MLEWNLSRTYDWRAGLHAAGSLILYEELSPGLTMTCPALLMRNTTDDPTWTSFIYHDHVSWFPGAAYPVEKLFREHYAERYLASASGTFRDIPDRETFFDEISTMKPEDWLPGTVDAIATASADGRRIVIKAVNYAGGAEHAARAIAGRRRSREGCRDVAHDQRRADGFRVPRASGCDRPGESNAGLREGLRRGPGPYTVAVVEIRVE